MDKLPPKPRIHLENREKNGARMLSPTANRNKAPIGEVLTSYLPQGAKVLEIASGSGEHAVHMCGLRADISWQNSDPDEVSRASQDDWASARPGQILASLPLNMTEEMWWRDLGKYDVIYCSNMIHIAPWEAALGLVKGGGKLLKPKGQFCLYGPFLEGTDTATSNLEFSERLKARNSDWGVRKLSDVKHIFSEQRFNLIARIVMPKENRLLIFEKT